MRLFKKYSIARYFIVMILTLFAFFSSIGILSVIAQDSNEKGIIFLLLPISSVIAGLVAKEKGRTVVGFSIWGILLAGFTILVVAFIPYKKERKAELNRQKIDSLSKPLSEISNNSITEKESNIDLDSGVNKVELSDDEINLEKQMIYKQLSNILINGSKMAYNHLTENFNNTAVLVDSLCEFALNKDENIADRADAIEVLGLIKNPKTIPVINDCLSSVKNLSDDFNPITNSSCFALGEIGDADALPVFTKLLSLFETSLEKNDDLLLDYLNNDNFKKGSSIYTIIQSLSKIEDSNSKKILRDIANGNYNIISKIYASDAKLLI